MCYFPVDAEWQARARIVLNLDENNTPRDIRPTEHSTIKPLETPTDVQAIVGDGNCY